MRAGRHARCEDALAWLARHDRLTSEDRMIQAWVAKARGRIDEALAALERIDSRDPLAPRALLTAGLIELQSDHARRAEAALRAAVALDAAFVPARQELVRLYARQQRLDELDGQFGPLADQGALDFGYLSFWSMTRNLRWDPAPDLDALRRSVAADPGDRASRLALAEGLRRQGGAGYGHAEAILAPLPTTDPDARTLRAQLALDRGDPGAAARLVADGPESHAGLARLRGKFALTHHDPVAAVGHLRTALALQPSDRTTLFTLGTALKLVGDSEGSRSCLAAARRYDALAALAARTTERGAASDARLLCQLGSACEGVGRRAEARAWYRLAIALDPLDAEAQRGLFRLGSSRGPAPVAPAPTRPGPATDGVSPPPAGSPTCPSAGGPYGCT
jgi:tetratricopeptide (TPR) repeat protein